MLVCNFIKSVLITSVMIEYMSIRTFINNKKHDGQHWRSYATMLCFGIHLFMHWLLQHRTLWPSSKHTCTSLAHTERCSAIHLQSAGTCSSHRDTGTMRLLHWLPVTYQIRYKLYLMMYTIHKGTSLSYISYITDTTTRISALPGHGRLWSTETSKFDIPCTRTRREFSVWQVNENGSLCKPVRNTSSNCVQVCHENFFELRTFCHLTLWLPFAKYPAGIID